MPRNVSNVKLTLRGINGYNNGIRAIDAVASIYNNPTYAKNARGLKVQVALRPFEYDWRDCYADIEETYTFTHRYGMNLDSNSENYFKIIDAGEGNTETREYRYYQLVLKMDGWVDLLPEDVWLADPKAYVDSNYAIWGIQKLAEYESSGDLVGVYSDTPNECNEFACSGYIIPVVSLKLNTQMTPKTTYYTESATSPVTDDGVTSYIHTEWNLG